MGYFQRTIRRGQARDQKAAFLEAARDAGPSRWTHRFDLRRADRTTYLRFVVRSPDGGYVGLFRGCDLFEEDPDVPTTVRAAARLAFRWFDRHLVAPDRLPTWATCWFRADADECVRQLRGLIEAYRMAGHQVWMVVCRDAGYVVYEDRHQVAAMGSVAADRAMRTASAW